MTNDRISESQPPSNKAVKGNLFRQEVVDRIAGPDDLSSYIKVLNPRLWLLLVGIGVAVAGLVFFVLSTGYPVWALFFGGTWR